MIGSERKYCEQVYISHSKSRLSASWNKLNFKFNAKTHQNNSQPFIWIMTFMLVLPQNRAISLTTISTSEIQSACLYTLVKHTFSRHPHQQLQWHLLKRFASKDEHCSHTECITKHETKCILWGFWILPRASGTV